MNKQKERHQPGMVGGAVIETELSPFLQASHEFESCQARDYRGVRDRYIAAYSANVAGITDAEACELETRALTAARVTASPEERLRLVYLAIVCRAKVTRRVSSAFVGYFPRGIHANVQPTRQEKRSLLSLHELGQACTYAAAIVGWCTVPAGVQS